MNRETHTNVEALIRDAVHKKRRSLEFRQTDLSDLDDVQWTLKRIVELIPNVKSLDFRTNETVVDAVLQTLAAQARHLPILKSLDFFGTEVSDVGLQALAAQASHLPVLQSLNFSATKVSNAGLQALAVQMVHLHALQSLDFCDTLVSDAGLQALAANAKHLHALQSLDLGRTKVSDIGLQALATQARNLPALQSLVLWETKVSDDGLQSLAAQALHLRSLQKLSFVGTKVSDDGLQALVANAHHLPALQDLSFGYTKVSDDGLQTLAAQARHLPALRSLDFAGTRVSDAGLQSLAAQVRYLPALQELNFENTKVSDDGLQALAANARHLPALQSLRISGTKVSVPDEILHSISAARIFEYVLGRERLLPEVKLLLVGQGEVGKTHLRKRLFDEPPDPIYHKVNEVRTHDIETKVWSTKAELTKESGDRSQESARKQETKATDVLCRVWDFGGQNHLHGSHRFFVGAERCLYLLVLNAAQDAEQNRLDYWLRLLAHHGRKQSGSGQSAFVERAPVLIVLTQCDRWELEGTKDNGCVDLRNAVDIARQREWYGANVVACIDGFGWSYAVERLAQPLQRKIKQRHTAAAQTIVEELQRHIPEVLGLNYLFPRGFFAMKQWIEDYFTRDPADADADAKHFNWRSNIAFRAACEEAKISEGLRESYLAICRSLGLVHWVGDVPEIATGNDADLKELVFNPEWIKRPVYELIQSPVSTQHDRGWMSNQRLRVRLPAPQPAVPQSEHLYRRLPFTERDCDHIQKLMLACRVAFRVEDRPDLANGLLIPDLIEPRKRKIPKHEFRVRWMGRDSLSIRHHLEFLPERVFLRFIADHYQLINDPQEDCWRDEVIVPYVDRRTNTTCEVLVQSELCPLPGEQPYLDISIRGGSPEIQDRIADKVLDEFDGILRREDLACGRIERDEAMRERDADEVRHARVHSNPITEAVIAEISQPKNELTKSVKSASTRAAAPTPTTLLNVFRKSGDGWEISFNGQTTHLDQPKSGLERLYRLLSAEGKPIRSDELADARIVETGIDPKSDLAVDQKTIQAVNDELERLKKVLESPVDLAVADIRDIREEIEKYDAFLKQNIGLKGESRPLDRKAGLGGTDTVVRNSIKPALKAIRRLLPALADHLEHCGSCDSHCFKYSPTGPAPKWVLD